MLRGSTGAAVDRRGWAGGVDPRRLVQRL